MALSNRLETYGNYERYLNAALENPSGFKVVLATPQAATRWRAKAYYFRKLWLQTHDEIRRMSSDSGERIKIGTTPWDDLVMKLDGNTISIEVEKDEILQVIAMDGVLPKDEVLGATEVLNTLTGPPAPMPFTLEVVGEEEFVMPTAEDFAKAQRELEREMEKYK